MKAYTLQTRAYDYCPTCGKTIMAVLKGTADGKGVLFCPCCNEPLHLDGEARERAREAIGKATPRAVKVL